METIKQRTRIEWWIALILVAAGLIMPIVLIIGIPLDWWYEGGNENLIVGITAGGVMVFIAALVVMMYFATYYQLDENGLTVRNGYFHKRTVAYSDILHAEKSINIINRPKTWAAPFTVIGIRVDYKKDGKETWFFIAPKDREGFLKQLQERI